MYVWVHGRIGGGITIRFWHISIVRFAEYAYFCHSTQQQLVYNFDLNCSAGNLLYIFCCCIAYCWSTAWPNLHYVMDTAKHSATQYAIVCMHVCMSVSLFVCMCACEYRQQLYPLGFKSSPYQQMVGRKNFQLQ